MDFIVYNLKEIYVGSKFLLRKSGLIPYIDWMG